jgi:hypothetical protein
VIKKAATAGQVTICSAVCGRGTDFFCKDQRVLDGGGVHIIQTFLSAEKSEEIQIHGRTARQGKHCTYQLILLGSDLKELGLDPSQKDRLPRSPWYDWLSRARERRYGDYCNRIATNLQEATMWGKTTHQYFDALLEGSTPKAANLFKNI